MAQVLVLGSVMGPQGDKGDVGPQGETGPQGPKGDTGPAGYTPVKGVDYFTAEDTAGLVRQVITALPTWQGGSY